MIPVPMREDGPDVDLIEELVAADPAIKGMWCVPVFSNPTGITYSWENVRRLRPDAHRGSGFPAVLGQRLRGAHADPRLRRAGRRARPGRGGGQPATGRWCSRRPRRSPSPAPASASSAARWATSPGTCSTPARSRSARTRSTNCVTCGSSATPTVCGCRCSATSELLAPKFALVAEILEDRLGESKIASWTDPKGGYFVSLDVLPGTARRTIALAKDAGIAVTEAGAVVPVPKRPGRQEHSDRADASRRCPTCARRSTVWRPARCWRPPSRCWHVTSRGPSPGLGSLLSVALYRKYRPATFAEVVGQEHVTEPLSTALYVGPDQPRLPVLRSAGLREDVVGADPGPLAELRAGADGDAVRRVRLLCGAGAQRAGQRRRRRTRRRQPRRRRRHPRAARPRVLRPRAVAVPHLHRRRSAHGHHGRLQRAAEDRRGTAGTPDLRVRHHRAGEGAAHHPLAHPSLPVPAAGAADHARPARTDLRAGERRRRRRGVPAGDPGRRRVTARHPVGARPAAGRRRGQPGRVRAGAGAARRHRRRADRRCGRRAGRRRRRGAVRRRRVGDRRRPRPAPVRHRSAGAVPRPDRAAGGSRRRRPRCGRCAGRRAGPDA